MTMTKGMQDVLDDAKKSIEEKEKASDEKKVEGFDMEGITPEIEEAIIKKKFGVPSDQLSVKQKEEITETEEQKEERLKKEKQNAIATGLSKGWFTKELYDEYATISTLEENEIAKKKFIEDNPELGDKAGEVFEEFFALNEDDELDDDSPEAEEDSKKPNLKKKLAKELLKKSAKEYVNNKYSNVISAQERYTSEKQNEMLREKNLTQITAIMSEMPSSIDVEISGEKYGYKITEEDMGYLKSKLVEDEHLLGSKDELKKDEVIEIATLILRTKNFEKIVSEISESRLIKEKEAYERGEKGVILDRESGEGGTKDLTEGEQYLQRFKK